MQFLDGSFKGPGGEPVRQGEHLHHLLLWYRQQLLLSLPLPPLQPLCYSI